MTDQVHLQNWIDAYVRAWNSNQPDEIGNLFAEDGLYYTAPFRPPWRGRAAIVAGWLERKDEPGQTRFRWDPVIVTDDLYVVQGVTEYLTQPPVTEPQLRSTCFPAGQPVAVARTAAPTTAGLS